MQLHQQTIRRLKYMPEPTLNVEWDNNLIKSQGFTSRPQAERFIGAICQKIAPGKTYQIITPIPY